MATIPIDVISEASDLETLISAGDRVVVNVHAPWAPPCAQMNLVFAELHKTHPSVRYATAAAEQLPELTASYNISTVPTFLLFGDNRLVRRQTGANAPGLVKDVEWLSETDKQGLENAACEMVAKRGEITLLMKGTPDRPRCGFSRQVVEILKGEGIVFEFVDVLEGGEFVREGMKKWTGWGTYPMVFARGRLVGGVDVMRELKESGNLIEELGKDEGGVLEFKTKEEAKIGGGEQNGEEAEGINKRLEGLTKREGVMVFMKGNKEAPRCGFSRRVVELLKGEGVEFGSVDILEDDGVRQGMKTYSDWPTFPQVYAGGNFVGGLDVLIELKEAGELRGELGLEG